MLREFEVLLGDGGIDDECRVLVLRLGEVLLAAGVIAAPNDDEFQKRRGKECWTICTGRNTIVQPSSI